MDFRTWQEKKDQEESERHTPAKFFAGTCECYSCVKNIGLERGSPYEYEKRKARPIVRGVS